MVIVKLMGGLGNQMFQYAMGRAIELRNQTTVLYDKGFYDIHTQRPYSLGCFLLDCKFATPENIANILGETSFFKKIRRFRDKFYPLHKKRLVNEPFFHFYSPFLGIGNKTNSYISGYWQSEKYFADYADVIRRDFQFKIESNSVLNELADKILTTNSINLHVRRGDYINNPETNKVHGTCSLDYYQTAINKLRLEVTDPHIFVFSDDIEWCRGNINLDIPTFFVDRKDDEADYIDMWLMSLCKHHVIANSSFSWWGAWLSNYPEKIVYAPKEWFRATSDKLDTKDLLPESWRTI